MSFLSIVWCYESARIYDHITGGRASVHFKLICSCTCTCIWKEDARTCTSKRSILFFFTLCSILTLLGHLNIISRRKQLAHACTISLCAHKDVPAPLAR